ncbi:PREDICTED: uncharacterized protein LOC109584486 [Amphimedon queenslandica]|nr:PREDICTED: uncharacterized protein LOC109584486 [Amphimedon queenslandica]|eukprot:XP_019855799.1 PREDICTED: uncharacterized protein LOC109584486 [Amphimedon queenslandica]
MDLVVKESAHEFGSTRQKLKQYLASYCNTTTSTSDESHLPEDFIIPDYLNDGKITASGPLKLSDVLEQSKVHYSIWETIVVFIKKLFVPLDDPERHLRNAEIDAFLVQLEMHFIAGCHNFFKNIKPKIVEGYLKQHQEIAERHIADVERLYFEQREAMDTQVKKWRKQAKFNKELVQYHSELCENMKKQKAHLLSLADRFGISLCSEDSQDE